MRARDDREVAARARNERERIARDDVREKVDPLGQLWTILYGMTEQAEPDHEWLFETAKEALGLLESYTATHTKPVVWCRCGDGIEDPKCKTCYMTDREPSAVEALREMNTFINRHQGCKGDLLWATDICPLVFRLDCIDCSANVQVPRSSLTPTTDAD